MLQFALYLSGPSSGNDAALKPPSVELIDTASHLPTLRAAHMLSLLPWRCRILQSRSTLPPYPPKHADKKQTRWISLCLGLVISISYLFCAGRASSLHLLSRHRPATPASPLSLARLKLPHPGHASRNL